VSPLPEDRVEAFVDFHMHGFRFSLRAGPREAAAIEQRVRRMLAAHLEPEPGVEPRPVTFDLITAAPGHDWSKTVAGLVPSAERQVFQIGPEKGYGRYFFSDDRSAVIVDGHFVLEVDRGAGAITAWLISATAGEGRSMPDLNAYFLWAIIEWFALGDHYLLHAAGVAGSPCGIAIIGESGWGKSTTSISLVKRGMGFLGDDLLFVDSRGTTPAIRAFTKPVKVDARTIAFHPELAPLRDDPDARILDGGRETGEWGADIRRFFDVEIVRSMVPSALLFVVPARGREPGTARLPAAGALERLLAAGEHQHSARREAARFAALSALVASAKSYRCLVREGALFDVDPVLDLVREELRDVADK